MSTRTLSSTVTPNSAIGGAPGLESKDPHAGKVDYTSIPVKMPPRLLTRSPRLYRRQHKGAIPCVHNNNHPMSKLGDMFKPKILFWHTIPCVDQVSPASLPISKRMTTKLSHSHVLRKLMDRNSQTGWNTCNTGRTRLGSKCCMNEPGGIQHVRAIQRQSDGEKLDANMQSFHEILERTARNTVYWFNQKGRRVLFYDTMQVESSVNVVK